MSRKYLIGASLGLSGLEAILSDDNFNILEKKTSAFPANLGKDSIVSRLAKTITSLSEYHNAFAVGISVPATFDQENKKVIDSSIKEIEDINLFTLLAKKIDKPIFFFRRNLSIILSEQAFGAAKNLKEAVLVEIGRDISCALLINGKIYKGANNQAGLIGETIVDITREKRNEDGTFASLISQKGIENLTGKSVYELLKDSKNTNLVSKQIIRDLKESLLTGLVNIKLLLDPQAFIICGDILENFSLFEPAFNDLQVEVKKGEIGPSGASLGAAIALYNKVNNKKSLE
jgi:predicted NBD/HSP70 family sugar kinase